MLHSNCIDKGKILKISGQRAHIFIASEQVVANHSGLVLQNPWYAACFSSACENLQKLSNNKNLGAHRKKDIV